MILDGELVPQEFCAATDTVPPKVSTTAVIEFVVDAPDQPLGKVHTYDDAPETAGTDNI